MRVSCAIRWAGRRTSAAAPPYTNGVAPSTSEGRAMRQRVATLLSYVGSHHHPDLRPFGRHPTQPPSTFCPVLLGHPRGGLRGSRGMREKTGEGRHRLPQERNHVPGWATVAVGELAVGGLNF
jgi:hypothetical protein